MLIYKKKFVKCWTNRKLHFNNHATSQSRNSYAMLKRELNIFIDDLKVIVDSLKLLLINQRYDYIEVVQLVKTRLSFRFKAFILRDLTIYVTLYALHKIIKQYNLVTATEESLPQCTKIFTTTMLLFYAYKI